MLHPALDRLLAAVEEANLEDGHLVLARPWQVSRALSCGVPLKRRPTGGELHAAILDAMDPDAVEDAPRSRSRRPRAPAMASGVLRSIQSP